MFRSNKARAFAPQLIFFLFFSAIFSLYLKKKKKKMKIRYFSVNKPDAKLWFLWEGPAYSLSFLFEGVVDFYR